MRWTKCTHQYWQNGWTHEITTEYRSAVTDDGNGVFLVFAHYGKGAKIKNYSVWYQDKIMLRGGDNFALKIKNCISFEEGKLIAEQYYNAVKDGNHPRDLGTQYINDTTFDGPFVE